MDYPPNDDNQSQFTPQPQPPPPDDHQQQQPPQPHQPEEEKWEQHPLDYYYQQQPPQPQPTDTPVPTTTTPSITDQVTQALGATLDPNDTVYDTVNESNGAVAVDVYTTTTVSLDDGGHARIFAVEKAIWQANISGISSVQATVYELDTDGTQIPMYKAIVSADRAQSIPWDSISPDAAWRLQYNETWTCRGGIGCPYTTPVTNGP